jgi:hypothetical protein
MVPGSAGPIINKVEPNAMTVFPIPNVTIKIPAIVMGSASPILKSGEQNATTEMPAPIVTFVSGIVISVEVREL